MRPRAQSAGERNVTLYRETIDRYLRYILIRSLAYTNDRVLAGRIAVYTLITTCLLAGRLRNRSDLGLVVDTVIEMVGDDQCGDLRSEVSGSPALLGMTCLRFVEEFPLFLLDDRMCDVAGAINGIDRFERELLVLHHIERLDASVLAGINEMSLNRIESIIAQGERQFVEILRGLSSWEHEIEPDVHSLLTDFAACLDPLWSANLGAYALQYLAEHGQ